MRCTRLAWRAGIAALLLWIVASAPAVGQETNRAGLVVIHGDGSVVTRCVEFSDETISGADLLALSKLDLAVEASGMGATICRLDNEGCNYPRENCFCQCQSTPCIYWTYWRQEAGKWTYSNLGASNTTIRNGDVQGWRWGESVGNEAEPPTAISFDMICAGAQREATTTVEAPVAGAGNTAETSRAEREMALPAVGAQGDADEVAGAEPVAPTILLAIVVTMLVAGPLAAAALYLVRQRRQRG